VYTRAWCTAHVLGVKENQDHPYLEYVPASWAMRYRRIARLADARRRVPRRSDEGVDPADVSWIADQKRAEGLSFRQRWLLALLPGWEESTRDGAWYKRAEDLRQFIATHERLPRVRTTDAFERALAHWLSRQRVAVKENRLSRERADALAYALRSVPGGA